MQNLKIKTKSSRKHSISNTFSKQKDSKQQVSNNLSPYSTNYKSKEKIEISKSKQNETKGSIMQLNLDKVLSEPLGNLVLTENLPSKTIYKPTEEDNTQKAKDSLSSIGPIILNTKTNTSNDKNYVSINYFNEVVNSKDNEINKLKCEITQYKMLFTISNNNSVTLEEKAERTKNINLRINTQIGKNTSLNQSLSKYNAATKSNKNDSFAAFKQKYLNEQIRYNLNLNNKQPKNSTLNNNYSKTDNVFNRYYSNHLYNNRTSTNTDRRPPSTNIKKDINTLEEMLKVSSPTMKAKGIEAKNNIKKINIIVNSNEELKHSLKLVKNKTKNLLEKFTNIIYN